MWPIFLYMTKDECLRGLRQLELDAYSMLVSALRAQGPLTSDKRNLLRDTCKVLNINTDRHKCEVRRAVNDEKLNTIAYQVNGLDVSNEDWCQEGRRVMPMLQRISPHTLHPILTEDSHKYPDDQPGSEDSGNNLDMLERPSINSSRILRSCDALEPDKSYSAKKVPNQNHKLMMVSNAETTPTSSILHKTLSVPISKITKLNLDKFKIVPSSFPSGLQVSSVTNVSKNFISKTGKRIIPLSQLQMLNHKFSSKGGIKVLPISSKILGKNITMTRITNQKVPALSKIKVENIEILHEITGSNESNEVAMEDANETTSNEEIVVDEVDVEQCDEVSDSKKTEK